MRFMMMMYPSPRAEAGEMPTEAEISAMMTYNEALGAAGILLAGEGLHPTSRGARVRFAGGKPRVTDGPFAEAKEVIGGFWMIQVKSKEEAVAWATRCPAGEEDFIELRQVFDASDFPAESLTPELAAREDALREQSARQAAQREG